MKEQRSDIWPHASRATLALGILALAYALYLWFFASSAEFYGWVSTLFSTLLSVFFALVVGLALFEHQTRETSRRRRRELMDLLRTELQEVAWPMRDKRSKIHLFKATFGTYMPLQFRAKVEQHYPNALIAEEAAKSGLFGSDLTAKLLALSVLMRVHHRAVEEAFVASLAVAGREALELVADEDPRARVRYGMAVQSLIESEERVVRACEETLELSRRSDAHTDVDRLAETPAMYGIMRKLSPSRREQSLRGDNK